MILFGSCGRGEESERSDLELTVVLRPSEEPPRRDNPIRRVIAEGFVLLVDLLICSYRAFAAYCLNSMLSRVLEDSEVLCDRQAARGAALSPK